MLYSELITILRRESRDIKQPMHDSATGDGVSTYIRSTEYPIIEDSYTVKVGGVTQTDTTDYIFDLDSGWVGFDTAVASGTGITMDYLYANVNDTGWINIINDTIRDLDSYGYFKNEVVDETTLTTIADTIEYSCPTGCKELCNVWFKMADVSNYNWCDLSERANWRYNKQANKLYLDRPLTAGYPLKVQYLEKYTLYDDLTDTIDLQDEYMNILKMGTLARYYEHLIGSKMEIESKITREVTVTPMQNIQSLASHYEKRYESAKVRSKPMPPMKIIFPNIRRGANP